MKKVTVIGSGSWGTALAVMLAEHGHEVTIWSRRQEAVDELVERRANEKYLPGVKIPAEIGATTDRAEAVAAAEIVILAVPSRAVRQTAKDFAPYFKKEQILVNVAKGLEEGSLLRLSEVIRECVPECAFRTEPRRRSRTESPFRLPDCFGKGRNGKAGAEGIYEPALSAVYQYGYDWRGNGRSPEKHYGSGGGHV